MRCMPEGLAQCCLVMLACSLTNRQMEKSTLKHSAIQCLPMRREAPVIFLTFPRNPQDSDMPFQTALPLTQMSHLCRLTKG